MYDLIIINEIMVRLRPKAIGMNIIESIKFGSNSTKNIDTVIWDDFRKSSYFDFGKLKQVVFVLMSFS